MVRLHSDTVAYEDWFFVVGRDPLKVVQHSDGIIWVVLAVGVDRDHPVRPVQQCLQTSKNRGTLALVAIMANNVNIRQRIHFSGGLIG